LEISLSETGRLSPIKNGRNIKSEFEQRKASEEFPKVQKNDWFFSMMILIGVELSDIPFG
jgi:hypothetical protein